MIGIALYPFFVAFSDRWGRRAVYLAGAAFMAAATRSSCFSARGRAFLIWLAVILAYNHCPTLMFAVEATYFSELFGPGSRYTGLSITYQISAIASGFMPLIGTWFIKMGGGGP